MGRLGSVDISIIILLFAVYLAIGLLVSRFAGKSTENFFLSGRRMPWWLLGVAMVATTFSTDTPNLVTDIVRNNGVSGNWVWWAFLLTGMLTVFIYAKLWRRSRVMTDVEFYEIRYSGKEAAFLRGFRAIWMGLFFNVIVMAGVTLAAIKIGNVMFGLSPFWTIVVAGGITLLYSTTGGLSAVLWTDFVQFMVAMTGAVAAAYFALGHADVQGIDALLVHPNVAGKLSLLPDFNNTTLLWSLLIIPLAVQWWASWYPGAEPGGGSYVAQRMLAAKNEKHAVGATMFFNVAHYALRPWPWIVVALCSLVVFPDLDSLRAAFPNVPDRILKDDLGYPAMLVTVLPVGWLGLVTASLIAAYMSTIATHLNLGSSYLVNDFYRRFWNPRATEREAVMVGRLSTVVLLVLTGILATLLENALQLFQLILLIGAGTGMIFLLRWFWWRINSFSEISAMIVSFVVALYWELIDRRLGVLVYGPAESAEASFFLRAYGIPGWAQFPITVAIVTVVWLAVTFMTRPVDDKTLFRFVQTVRPGGPGWASVRARARAAGVQIDADKHGWDVPQGILCMVLGTVAVYSALFTIGYFIYQQVGTAMVTLVISLVSGGLLWMAARGLHYEDEAPAGPAAPPKKTPAASPRR